MLEFAVPVNLDDMSLDSMDYEHWALWLAESYSEQDIGEDTARLLIAYAKNKSLSIERRLEGKIQAAQEIEASNEYIYHQLPVYYRW